MPPTYSADDLTHLEGLDPVRKRPGMYIGGVGSAGLHHLAWEVLDNAVDEAMNGHATDITLTLHEDASTITITDNGRGIPTDKHKKTGKTGVELVFTELHAGGKFEAGGNYKTSGGLHGVGASVVNALSKTLNVEVVREGYRYRMAFSQGKVTKPLKKVGEARGSGTHVTFHPDPTVFPRTTFNPETLKARCEVVGFLHRGVKVTFDDQTGGGKTVFTNDRGVVDFLEHTRKQAAARPVHDTIFEMVRSGEARVEVAFRWTESTDEVLRSFVNGIPTASGGSHENGLRAGVGKACVTTSKPTSSPPAA